MRLANPKRGKEVAAAGAAVAVAWALLLPDVVPPEAWGRELSRFLRGDISYLVACSWHVDNCEIREFRQKVKPKGSTPRGFELLKETYGLSFLFQYCPHGVSRDVRMQLERFRGAGNLQGCVINEALLQPAHRL
ncbi:hypothetical protein EMWEY_00060450, partial [Eimeria maxima]